MVKITDVQRIIDLEGVGVYEAVQIHFLPNNEQTAVRVSGGDNRGADLTPASIAQRPRLRALSHQARRQPGLPRAQLTLSTPSPFLREIQCVGVGLVNEEKTVT